MSLTSYLTDPNHQALKTKFKTEFPFPGFSIKKDLVAVPLTKNYGIVGTAFDYLLRFYLQYQHQNKCIINDEWVARYGFEGIKNVWKGKKTELSKLSKRFSEVKRRHKLFLQNGKLSNELIAGTLFLAKLDLYVRSRLIAPDIFIESDLDIQDLRNLYNAINPHDFIADEKCFLNPHFGDGSALVRGADADIILDDTLIDVKVTKNLKIEREYLNQIIGYYILSLIGKINFVHSGKIINNVGIYFARHSLLWKISIESLGDEKKIEEFKNWFISYFETLKNERKLARIASQNMQEDKPSR